MDWLAVTPALLAVAVLLYLPGSAALRGALSLPWGVTLLYAPPVSAGLMAVLTLLFGVSGVPWTPLTAALTLLAVAVTWVGVELWKRRAETPRRPEAVEGESGSSPPVSISAKTALHALVGSAVFAVSYGWVVLSTVGSPAEVPTVGDAHFHLRAVQLLIESRDASPLGPFPSLYPHLDTAPFYPTLWHSLVVPLVGQLSVVEATNVLALFIGLWVWPMGLAALASSLAPRLPLQALVAPVLAIPFVLMPAIELFGFAVYPFAISVALLGSTLGLLVHLIDRPSKKLVIAFLFAALGVSAGQPTTGLFLLAAVAIWGLVVLTFRLGTLFKQGRPWLASAVTVGVVSVIAAAVIAIPRLGIVRGLNSRGTEFVGVEPALANFLLGPTYFLAGSYLMPALLIATVAGVLLTVRFRGNQVIALLGVLLFGMYVAASGPDSFFRTFTSPWWKDASRFAIILTVLIVAFSAVTVAFVVRWAEARTPAARVEPSAAVAIVVGALGATALLPSKVFWEEKELFISDSYSRLPGTTVELTEEEVQLLEAVDDYLPEGTIVVGDPDSGLAWLSVLSDADQFQGMRVPYGEDQEYLGKHFDDILTDPKICEILEENGISAFIQSDSPGTQHAGWHVGYNSVDTSVGFKLLVEVGGAQLYEITACD